MGEGAATGSTGSTRVPTVGELAVRMAAARACGTARGELRYRVVEPDAAPGSADGETRSVRFWFAAPRGWRLEDDDGVRRLQGPEHSYHRDQQGRLQRRGPDVQYGHGVGDPARYFDAADLLTGAGATHGFVPHGVPRAVELHGRSAWEVRLEPPPDAQRTRSALTLVVDDDTGVLLRYAVAGHGVLGEITDLETGVAIDPTTFVWDGPYATDLEEELARREATHRWLDAQRFPVPRWWPTGPASHARDGDARTGAFFVVLEVEGHPGLARWPQGGVPPARLEEHTGHVHRWSDARWEWALVVQAPLSDEDLARVVDSIPPDEEHRA